MCQLVKGTSLRRK